MLKRPLLLGAVNLAKVVDAGVHLGLGASLYEVGNGNGRQQADDGHDNHDFNQRESRGFSPGCFHNCYLLFAVYYSRPERGKRQLYNI